MSNNGQIGRLNGSKIAPTQQHTCSPFERAIKGLSYIRAESCLGDSTHATIYFEAFTFTYVILPMYLLSVILHR